MAKKLNEKHLEFLQNAIARMASNSFLLKGWNATITAGLFALAAKNCNSRVAIIAFLPAIAFWGLDAFYLREERLFRQIYDSVRLGSLKDPFSMSTNLHKDNVETWFYTLFTPSVFCIHGPIILAILTVIYLMR